MQWRLLFLGGVASAAMLQIALAKQPAPRVVLVQPSAEEVPANILRMSMVFDAPVEGAVLPRIALARTDGTPLTDSFLPQELWSPDGKVLTLLFHPGRVKSGLVAREQRGPIVSEGDDVVLTFDGRPVKRWRVGPMDREGPVAAAWKLSHVRSGLREPLVVTLDGAIDGRDSDYLAIANADNQRVEGRAQLRDGETIWTFTPADAWKPGAYHLMVRGTLEDPSGNRLGGHFETAAESPQPRPVDEAITFRVDPSKTP